uniref:MobA-like NTP transferase domain-containing protein n=1 Tax=viral metagenome TaxID=1070528 RepID=A0A6M3JB20_9ZZZZ
MYKFCVLTAGEGKRNAYAKGTNKSLLKLGGVPIIDRILAKVPRGVRVLIVVGHNAHLVEAAVKNVTFVRVEKYRGMWSGPGYSLLQCAPLLQCPFIFTACDTIVLEDYPEPDRNWVGVSTVEDTEPYLTVTTAKGLVTKVYDKIKNAPSHMSSIGVMGIRDYREFWEGLSNPHLVNGEHQTTDGLNALIAKGLHYKYFTWFDTGTTGGYENADRYFSRNLS